VRPVGDLDSGNLEWESVRGRHLLVKLRVLSFSVEQNLLKFGHLNTMERFKLSDVQLKDKPNPNPVFHEMLSC